MWADIVANKENLNYMLGFISGGLVGITFTLFLLRQTIKNSRDLSEVVKGFSDIAKTHSKETRKNLELLQKQRESLEKEKAILEAREAQKAVFGKE